MNNLTIFLILVLCGLVNFKYSDFNKNDKTFITQMFFFLGLIFITKENNIYGLLFLICMINFSQITMRNEGFSTLSYSDLEPIVNTDTETKKCDKHCKDHPELVTRTDNCSLSDLMRKSSESNQIPIQINNSNKDVMPTFQPNKDLNLTIWK
jgi:hypothetical protein